MVKMNILDLDFSLKMHTLKFSNSRDVVKSYLLGYWQKRTLDKLLVSETRYVIKLYVPSITNAKSYIYNILYFYKTVTNSSLERETGINNFHCLSLLYITYLKSLI